MNTRYIVLGTDRHSMFGGVWGSGATLDEARKNFKKAKGKKIVHAYKFTSDLPFAPTNRPANADESDCWVGRDGSMSWVRCERAELEIVKA